MSASDLQALGFSISRLLPKSPKTWLLGAVVLTLFVNVSIISLRTSSDEWWYNTSTADNQGPAPDRSPSGQGQGWWNPVSIFFPGRADSRERVDIALEGSWREKNVTAFNERNIALLESCRRFGGKCRENQDKLVILAWGHFASTIKGALQGEDVWCDSVMDAIHALGYSMLIMDNSMDLVNSTWRKYHNHVQLILWNDGDSEGHRCMRDPTCVHLDADLNALPPNATHLNIPIWKIFSFHWWNGANHPLGGPFTVSPENYTMWPGHAAGADNYFLGYSLEKTCLQTPYIPYPQRNRQAYIFAKFLHYFTDDGFILRVPEPGGGGNNRSDQLRTDFFARMSDSARMTFIANFHHDLPGAPAPPLGITEIPKMGRAAFQNVIAHTRLVMGLGNPLLSPTPWESLCLGVPFVNPIKNWDRGKPEERGKWVAQHDGVLYLGVDEPYVYHVKVGDREGLKEAVTKAMDTPIERWTPPQMKMGALIDRTRTLLETDWRLTAQAQITKLGKKGKP